MVGQVQLSPDSLGEFFAKFYVGLALVCAWQIPSAKRRALLKRQIMLRFASVDSAEQAAHCKVPCKLHEFSLEW